MAIRRWRQAEVPAEIETQVVEITEREWPSDGPPRTPRHDVLLDPVTVVNVVNGRVVAALTILSKEISHGGESYLASGLAAVVTDSELRGQGHGLVLVEAALSLILASGADLSVFTCDRDLCSFYSRGGWKVVEGSALVGGVPRDPLISTDFGKVLMLRPISAKAVANESDFAASQIEVYPGTLDRLW